jgi:hypothetical protein
LKNLYKTKPPPGETTGVLKLFTISFIESVPVDEFEYPRFEDAQHEEDL